MRLPRTVSTMRPLHVSVSAIRCPRHVVVVRLAILFPALLLLLLLLCCAVAASSSSLTAVSLTADCDRFSALALHDVSLAYRLQAPTVTLATSQQPATTALSNVQQLLVDFSTTSLGLTDAQVVASPTLAMYPILVTGTRNTHSTHTLTLTGAGRADSTNTQVPHAPLTSPMPPSSLLYSFTPTPSTLAQPAIVPIYRLDTLTAAGLTLTLSRLNLALIYAGQLTWWNDSRLAADNPSVTLPALRVTVVYHDEPLSINAILFPALAKFYANFTQYAVPSSIFGTAKPVWPLGLYAAHIGVTGTYAAAATVTANNGAIGYTSLALALDMKSSVANKRRCNVRVGHFYRSRAGHTDTE